MKRYAVGIDLGGTNVRFGLVDANGKIVRQTSRPVGNDRTHKAIVALLKDGICELKGSKEKILGVGVGAPGFVDFKKGTIVRSPHYPDWHYFPLKKELSRAVKLPVTLDNDANLIAAGEMWKGAGKKFKSFIMVTLGTGIGGGIVVDRKIFHGDLGSAGEIGHQIMHFDGERCDCGGRGCWENYVSIGGLKWFVANSDDPRKDDFLKRFAGDIDKVTPKILFEMAMDGDIFALAIWKKFGAYLGAGIASLINVTGIFSFVIGGGIGNAFELFIGEAKSEIGKRLYKETSGLVSIEQAKLGDSAGIIGSVSNLWLE